MKFLKTFTILILLIEVFFLLSCKEETVFEAVDELHYISLNEKGKNFKILYNGFNFAEGKYMIRGDSVLLNYNMDEMIQTYNSNFLHANDILTRILLIENTKNKIVSIDGKKFCANIVKNKIKN